MLRVFQGCCIQECVKDIAGLPLRNFKGVSRVFQRLFMDISRFLSFLKDVLFLTVCFKVFTKEFLEECFGNFQGFFRSVSMEIQRSF